MRWTVIESPQPPERSQAEQTIVAQPLASNLVMPNWVEYNGTSVSEVIDTEQGKFGHTGRLLIPTHPQTIELEFLKQELFNL